MIKPYYESESVTLYHGRVEDLITEIPLVDAVITDPPYEMTDSKWDKKLPSDWLVKTLMDQCPEGSVVCTASQPFTSELVLAAGKHFKHEWIWQKNAGSNFGSLKWHPFKEHENIIVFALKKGNYYPVMQERAASGLSRVQSGAVKYSAKARDGVSKGGLNKGGESKRPDLRYPSSVQKFNRERGLHPTQKPVKLFEYLVETYSQLGDTVLDPFAGSGTTLVAASNLGRKVIGFEMEESYCEVIAQRLDA